MGMFDEITCEYPLPDGFVPEHRFQTKDLENVLNHYTLAADGRLWLDKWRMEPAQDTPADEPPSASWHPWDGYERIDEGLAPVPHHGVVQFYWSNINAAGPNGYATEDDAPYDSREYEATFTNGLLTNITGGQNLSDMSQPHVSQEDLHKEWARTSAERAQRSEKAAAELLELAQEITSDPNGIAAFTSAVRESRKALGFDAGREAMALAFLKGAAAVARLVDEGDDEERAAATQIIINSLHGPDGLDRMFRSPSEEFFVGVGLLVRALGGNIEEESREIKANPTHGSDTPVDVMTDSHMRIGDEIRQHLMDDED